MGYSRVEIHNIPLIMSIPNSGGCYGNTLLSNEGNSKSIGENQGPLVPSSFPSLLGEGPGMCSP